MSKVQIKSRRLRFREMDESDFEILSSMLQDSGVMYAWERTFSDDEVYDWIRRNRERYSKDGVGYWIAEDKDTGEVIGQIGLIREKIYDQEHLGVGYILRKEHTGKGYASEGAEACLQYAFRELNAPRVIADIRPENIASVKVAESLGMSPTVLIEKKVSGRIMPHRVYVKRNPLVKVEEYRPEWKENFEKLKKFLSPLLEEFHAGLEHVGSTSVPGLAAKPVIDVDFVLPNWGRFEKLKESLAESGFIHIGDYGLSGREMFTESLHFQFRHNFYVCNPDSDAFRNHILLRDYLRGNPDSVARYGDLKKELAQRYPEDVDSYCMEKSVLISEFLTNAGMPEEAVEDIFRKNTTL